MSPSNDHGYFSRTILPVIPPPAMHDAQHRHGLVVFVPVDDDVGRDNADADVLPECRSRRAAPGMIGKTIVEFFEQLIEFGSGAPTRLGREIG